MMCHPPYGSGGSEHTVSLQDGRPEPPDHFHVLQNGSIWKTRDARGRFVKPHWQKVKVCVKCGKIWEASV